VYSPSGSRPLRAIVWNPWTCSRHTFHPTISVYRVTIRRGTSPPGRPVERNVIRDVVASVVKEAAEAARQTNPNAN
jgi:hypothetical protein